MERAEGHARHPERAVGWRVLPGSEEHGMSAADPPGTGEASPSPSREREGDRFNNLRAALRRIPRGDGAKPWMHDRYRQAKATKRGGKGGEASEDLVVPKKPGNRAQRDPVEGRGSREGRTESGERCRRLREPRASQRDSTG